MKFTTEERRALLVVIAGAIDDVDGDENEDEYRAALVSAERKIRGAK